MPTPQGGGGGHRYLYTYMSSYISIYFFTRNMHPHMGIITIYMITYPQGGDPI